MLKRWGLEGCLGFLFGTYKYKENERCGVTLHMGVWSDLDVCICKMEAFYIKFRIVVCYTNFLMFLFREMSKRASSNTLPA